MKNSELPKCDTQTESEQMILEKYHWQSCSRRDCHKISICNKRQYLWRVMKCSETRYMCTHAYMHRNTHTYMLKTSMGPKDRINIVEAITWNLLVYRILVLHLRYFKNQLKTPKTKPEKGNKMKHSLCFAGNWLLEL